MARESEHWDHEIGCIDVGSLVLGLAPSRRASTGFLMLQVWIDDSGRGQEPVFVLAGYIGRVRNWIDFAHEWSELLRKHRLTCFKGSMSGSLSDKTVLEFVALIRRYALSGVRVVIPHRDFQNSLKNDRIAENSRWYFKQPYYLAFDCVFGGVLSYVRKRPSFEKVEFIFDYDVVDRRSLKLAYPQLLKSLGKDASLVEGEPTFRDDKRFTPLQAADLLAWHVRRDYYERARGHELKSPVWAALCELQEIQVELDGNDLIDLRAKTIAQMRARSIG